MLQKVKSYMMPIAMIVGAIFFRYVSALSFLTPYLIGLMLFITYTNISWRDIRFSKLHAWLLLVQIGGGVLVYMVLLPFHPIVAQGAMICVLASTATSAPIITKMLGGDIGSVATYTLLSNITLALVAPVLFAMIGNVEAESFGHSLLIISEKVFMLLLLPFGLALLLKAVLPKVHKKVRQSQSLSFYLWSAALIIITGKTVSFIVDQENPRYEVELCIAALALVICIGQFLIGRRLGKRYGDVVAGGQSLGQKNTILAIWMAQTYLNPISSIGPGAYVLWQNMVNSYQVWKKGNKNVEN